MSRIMAGLVAPHPRRGWILALLTALAAGCGEPPAGDGEPPAADMAPGTRTDPHTRPGAEADARPRGHGQAQGGQQGHTRPGAEADARPRVDAGPAGRDGAGSPQSGPRRATLVAVGDVLFGRYVDRNEYRPVLQGAAALDPFADVAPVVQRADLALANVESPVLVEPATFSTFGRLTFRAEPESLAVLAAAGFDVLSFANNHALNFGAAGLRETLAHVAAAGLIAVGVGADQEHADAPAILELGGDAGGLRLAVLGRTTWLNGRAPPAHTAAIAYASSDALAARTAAAIRAVRSAHAPDFVIVFLHWGFEYEPHPRTSQRRAARAMIDAGADLVLGHHPHTVQDVERYRGGVIAYSLGNFLFDNTRLPQRRSVIFEAVLEEHGGERRIAEVTLHPVLIDRRTRVPRLARGRDYLAWRRALALLAPGIAIAPEPPAAP